MEKSYIYCITNELYKDYIKVGQSSRPLLRRLNELNSKSVTICDFKLEYYIEVPTNDRFKIEKNIHMKIINKGIERVKGREFFKCTPLEVKKIFEIHNTLKYELEECNDNILIGGKTKTNNNINTVNTDTKRIGKYSCNQCNKIFFKKHNYTVHMNRINKCYSILPPTKIMEEPIYTNKCPHCNKVFFQKSNVKKHIENSCKILQQNKTTEINQDIITNIKKIIKEEVSKYLK